MKQVLILENSTDGMRIVKENAEPKTGKKEYVLGGVFTEFDVKNRNERIYTAEKFLPHLEELQNRITGKPGVVYGEFDHPENFDTALSRVSHKITKVDFLAEKNCIMGEIRLLGTRMGQEAKALVDDDCQIFVSSRAAGVTESNGVVTIKKLFTYDIVADPGFGSAKMEMKTSLNESLGFKNNSNFRIFEVTDESKINKLFEMNKDEMVTKAMLTDYSNYIKTEIEKLEIAISEGINGAGKTGTPDFAKMQKMMENYDSLLETQEKLVKYLDYVAENFQTIITENKALKQTTEKLIRHNDYLAENLEKSINYTKYVAEKLDKNIDFSDYIVENVEKNINFANYLSEGLNKLVEYSNYITENLNKSIEFADYLAENLDASIAFSDYIAENLNHSIDFSDYIVENLEGVIEFADYIAENTADTQDYTKYIAEGLDKHIGYSAMLAERLNAKRLNEGTEEEIASPVAFMKLDEEVVPTIVETPAAVTETPAIVETTETPAAIVETPAVVAVNEEEEEEEEVPGAEPVLNPELANEDPNAQVVAEVPAEEIPAAVTEVPVEEVPAIVGEVPAEQAEMPAAIVGEIPAEMPAEVPTEVVAEIPGVEPIAAEAPAAIETPAISITFSADMPVKIDGSTQTGKVIQVTEDGILVELTDGGEQVLKNSNELVPLEMEVSTMESVKENIQKLILEAKKRKASEEAVPHFFAFLNENEIASFKNLTSDEQERVIVAVKESNGYFCKQDVLKLMHKALMIEGETLEEKLMKSLPDDIKPLFESQTDDVKKSLLSQAKFYELNTEDKLIHFWRTRKITDNRINESRKTIANFNLIETNEMTESEIAAFQKRFENLR